MKSAETADEPQGEPRRASRIWRMFKTLLLIGFIAAVGVGGGLLYAVYHAAGGMAAVKTAIESWRDPGKKAFGDKTRLNILCLGVDYNHDSKGIIYTKHARTDTIFVVSIDRKGQGMSLLSIPRDLRVEIPGHGADKINSAYTYAPNGAKALTVQTVEKLLGVKIDHTLIIKPYAAEHLVDALGGINLDVEKDMDYDDNWGNLHIHLKKGMQHLDGRQAVGYIRFRKDEEGDRGRIRRQQQFMSTMLSQVKRVDTLTRINQVQSALQKDIDTSLQYDQLIDLAVLYKSFDRKKMKRGAVEGNDALVDDAYFMVADEAQKRKVVAQLLRDGDEALQPGEIRVEVLNASKIDGAASRVAEQLKLLGYQIVRVGNADKIARTQLVNRLGDRKASMPLEKVVASRGINAEVQQGAGLKTSDADITVVLGENYQ